MRTIDATSFGEATGVRRCRTSRELRADVLCLLGNWLEEGGEVGFGDVAID